MLYVWGAVGLGGVGVGSVWGGCQVGWGGVDVEQARMHVQCILLGLQAPLNYAHHMLCIHKTV